jgi:hypothetical protein
MNPSQFDPGYDDCLLRQIGMRGDQQPDPGVTSAYGAMIPTFSAFWDRMKSLQRSYGLASGAARTCLQAAGNCASVIGGRGFGGSFGGLGWSTESLNQ